jgi:hypothetical protein
MAAVALAGTWFGFPLWLRQRARTDDGTDHQTAPLGDHPG